MTSLEDLYHDPSKGLNKGAFIASAAKFGYTTKEALEHYSRETAAQIHKASRPHFNSIVAKPGSWAIDLTFYPDYATLPANRKKEGILVALEQTSRFAWCRPFRTKSPAELAPLLTQLINEQYVSFIVTDDGNEWKGQVAELFKKHNIDHFVTNRKGATSRVERFNRTLREKISRWFVASGGHAWVDVLPELIEAHNNTPSRVTLGYTPKEVIKNTKISSDVREHDQERGQIALDLKESFIPGLSVRTALEKAQFEKKTGPKWSTDIKKIERDGANRFLLRVRKADGKLERRRYAAWELQPVPEGTVETKTINKLTLDVPKTRKKKRTDQLLARESITASAIIERPRTTRGKTPARYSD